MKEKEPKQSFLTWESTALILTLVGAGFVLGSREARFKIGKELWLCWQGFRNEIKRIHRARLSEEEKFRFRRLMRQVFPEGLKAER